MREAPEKEDPKKKDLEKEKDFEEKLEVARKIMEKNRNALRKLADS